MARAAATRRKKLTEPTHQDILDGLSSRFTAFEALITERIAGEGQRLGERIDRLDAQVANFVVSVARIEAGHEGREARPAPAPEKLPEVVPFRSRSLRVIFVTSVLFAVLGGLRSALAGGVEVAHALLSAFWAFYHVLFPPPGH